ncbi:AraC family transcriptional regulator [Comamonas humi]
MYATSLDLSKIYSHPVLRSRSSTESQRLMCQAIAEHRLRWGDGNVDTALYRRKLGHIELLVLKYGAEVEVSPEAFDDFALVQVPLQGTADIEAGGHSTRIGNGEIAVLSARHGARIHWQAGCQQLIVKVPDAMMQGPAASSRAIWHSSVFKLAPETASQWLSLLQQMLVLLPPANGAAPSQAWLAHFEHALALYLGAHQPSPQSAGASPAGMALESAMAGRHRIDQLEAYIGSNLFEPLSLDDLADALGVTNRTLNALCQKYRGVSPMHLVRNLRLDEARRELLSSQSRNVTEIAIECGFGHLGRFSAYYKERFGELPRQTTRLHQ